MGPIAAAATHTTPKTHRHPSEMPSLAGDVAGRRYLAIIPATAIELELQAISLLALSTKTRPTAAAAPHTNPKTIPHPSEISSFPRDVVAAADAAVFTARAIELEVQVGCISPTLHKTLSSAARKSDSGASAASDASGGVHLGWGRARDCTQQRKNGQDCRGKTINKYC